jgi:uncharacterized protein (TIGR02246 family)
MRRREVIRRIGSMAASPTADEQGRPKARRGQASGGAKPLRSEDATLSVAIQSIANLSGRVTRYSCREHREVTMRKLVFALAFCLAATIPASAQDKGELQKLADQWTEAYNKNDIAKVSRMYTDDAVLLPPETKMIRGKEAIQTFWQKEAEQTTDLKVTVTDVKPLGSANAHAIFTSTVRTKGQQVQEVPGKGTALLQRSGEDWRIVVHVWNRDTGPATTGHGMMGQGMMGRSMMGQGSGMMAGMPIMRPRGHMMKLMFAIADTDGDGALSFEEVTTVHRRIFNRVDTSKDGKVTVEEVQAFMRE